MSAYRTAKTLLSLCICIQLFKIQKFLAMFIPKMGLATAVLRKCAQRAVPYPRPSTHAVAAYDALLAKSHVRY